VARDSLLLPASPRRPRPASVAVAVFDRQISSGGTRPKAVATPDTASGASRRTRDWTTTREDGSLTQSGATGRGQHSVPAWRWRHQPSELHRMRRATAAVTIPDPGNELLGPRDRPCSSRRRSRCGWRRWHRPEVCRCSPRDHRQHPRVEERTDRRPVSSSPDTMRPDVTRDPGLKRRAWLDGQAGGPLAPVPACGNGRQPAGSR
jgi:hypothetical protein